VNMYKLLTLSASPDARDVNESKQDGPFVPSRYRHIGMYELTVPYRRRIARQGFTVAVSARSMDEPQHRSQGASTWHFYMAYTKRRVRAMEEDRWPSLDPWPSYVCYPRFFLPLLIYFYIVAGSGKTVLSCVPP
jgi:hypothetical protein